MSFNDDETRASVAIAVLHSLRNGGLQGARFWDRGSIEARHKGLMGSLVASDSGTIVKDQYRVTSENDKVGERTVHSVRGQSLVPDFGRRRDLYSVDIEFVDNGTASYPESEGWLTDV